MMSEASDGEYSDARNGDGSGTGALIAQLDQSSTKQGAAKNTTSNQPMDNVSKGIGAKPGTSQKPKSSDNGLHMCKLCSFVQVDSKEDMCFKCSKEQTMDDPKDKIPPYFQCLLKPQTGVMKDPVLTPSGESYEKEHIWKHIESTGQHPVTKTPLSHDQLYDNKPLKEAAKAYSQGKNYDKCLKCKLTETFFKEPVTLPTGETYEHGELLRLKTKKQLKKNNVTQFDEKTLYKNKAVKAAAEYCEAPDPLPADLSRPSKNIIKLDIGPNIPTFVVHFHVLIPRTMWEIADSSVVRIRSGHPKLGNGNLDLVELYPECNSDDDLIQMGAELKLPISCYNHGIQYAYVVYSPRASLSSEREKIYDIERTVWSKITSHGEVSRYLQLPSSYVYRRVFHKFDTIVYPKEESKSFLQQLAIVKRPPPVKPDPPGDMRLKCFRKYIARFTDMLCTNEDLNIVEFCNEMENLFDSMYNQNFVIDQEHKICTFVSVEKEMLVWIQRTTDCLTKSSSIDSNDKVVSSFTILMLTSGLLKRKQLVSSYKSVVEKLYQILGKGEIKGNYKLVERALSVSSFREECVGNLRSCLQAIPGNSALTWIRVVPYYHFLSGEVVPSAKLTCEDLWKKSEPQKILPTNYWWSERDRCEMFMEVQKLCLFDSDPYLLPLCFSICPQRLVMKEAHPLDSAYWLSLQITSANVLTDSLKEKISAAFNEMKLKLIRLTLCENDTDKLLKKLLDILERLWNTFRFPFDVFFRGIEVVAIAVPVLQASHHTAKRVFSRVSYFLHSWIEGQIGRGFSDSFGGKNYKYSLEITKWNELKLHLSKTTTCSAANGWIDNIIVTILRKRIEKINSSAKLTILCEHSGDTTDASKKVINIVEESIADILKEVSGNRAIAEMQHCKVETRLFAKALSIAFDNQFMSCSFQPSLENLLQWEHWPVLLDLYSKDPPVLGPKYQKACDEANKFIQEVVTMVSNCLILVELLEQLTKKEAHFCQLVGASAIIDSSQEEFRKELNLCKSMLAAYEEHKQQLQVAVSCLSEVVCNIEGLNELKELLKEDKISERRLSDICVQENGNYSFPLFEIANALSPVLTKLKIMDCDCPNIFFTKASKRMLNEVINTQQRVPFEEIVTHVWIPAFDYCLDISDTLLDRSMTLDNVSKYFEHYDRGQLHRHVHDLVRGVGLCLADQNYYNSHVVDDCISAIHDFKKVMRCSRAAAVFLQLKERLALQGDFTNAEVLQSVGVASRENLQLKDIKTDVVSAGELLESATEEVNLLCLKKLSECCDILLWIKSIVTDVADLQAFVNLALETGTCGEDRYSKDRMSNLRSIGSEFAPLIFNIQPDTGFEELASELGVVWSALKSNPDLPQVLEACNGDLKWYMEVKNTQGNVEATSFGQLSNILNYGHFTIGDSKPEIHHQISDVVSLNMVEEDKQLPRSRYSLSELEDLESRLVLISGEDSQKQEEVDAYLKMLTLVRNVAEALLSLQQSGKIKYIGWILQFSCKCARNILTNLSCLALFIEEELDLWKSEVESARKHFYELNYYTTKQLLVLRNHIKQIMDDMDDPDSSVVAHALALLQSIYSDVSKESITEVLENPDDPDEEQLTSTADILQHCQFPGSIEGDATSDVSTHFSIPYTSEDSAPQTPKFTDKKYQLYTALVDYYGYDEYLAEKATDMYDDEDEAATWCEDHLDDPAFTNQAIAQKTAVSLVAMEASESMSDMNNAVGNSHVNVKHVAGGYVKQASVQRALEIESRVFKIQEPNEDITNSYLLLEDLGRFLSHVAKRSGGQLYTRQRPFPRKSGLKIGVPNLIVTNEENVLKTVLSLYTEDRSLPLPSPEEVLVCSESTTAEEVVLLWRRAIGDPGFKRLFCLVHPERLTYSDVDRALQLLFEFIKGKKGFRLVIVCSSVDESKSHVISKLHLYRRAYHRQEDLVLKDFLGKHITTQSRARSKTTQVTASSVDKDLSTVRVVISSRAGMGKSLYARRLSQKLGKITSSDKSSLVSVPIHGPDVTADEIIALLDHHHLDPYCKIYHFDIASSVVDKVANVLFSLLVLGGLCDSQGRVWRCHISQLYCIEITLSAKQAEIHGETSTLSLLGLLPQVHCISPVQVWNRRAKDDSDTVLADKDELQSVAYQRVYQFLKKHDNSENLDDVVFCSDTQGNLQEVIQVICKYSGVSNPSWREIRNFVQFLNIQLSSVENSLYLKDAIEGLKTFVVKFAIRMSKDFATSSLSGEIDAEEGVETKQTTLQQLQILDRHRWEERPHPYIFFNKDKATATFVGFTVSDSGDLLNPLNKGELIEKSIVASSLVKNLKRMKFDEDHSTLSSDQLVKKLCLFLGIPERDNPDKSYVLTQDNFIKILGIQMRFRCGIPVVLMGETGCGKTRLIRFMCDLANTAAENASTLLILKVHGGTTRDDVVRKVDEAKQRARENEKQGLDTVLFFDEANTTEAIGLIKEVLCDKQVQGQRITERINFVAACNPYRRHTDEMIKRLESAGLGYYVKGSETRQKLGEIPLRQLVYRVLELPPSLRPHVYDFGRLNDKTEVEYTKKIVENRVRKIQELGSEFVTAIAIVLASCQAYMRKKKDECSFVSLRDVERAMIVFKFFYRKIDAFDGLIKQRAGRKQQLDTSLTHGKATRSLILALSVCYHARLQDRSNFESTISSKFTPPLYLPGGAEQFRNEILWCQDVLLNEMKIPQNIAKNVALRENVFMMTICIELRIPLFLVGKPGSSKSLAKTIVSSSLSGRSSKSELLQKFKQVHMFSFQCSKYSTPESIVQVFKTAKSFQEKQDTKKYVSVVVLDEVGLAEDSPALPLKALHPLLEDGTEGGDDSNQIVKRKKRVAFVGISNWALDPAKMNRGVMVTRGDPTTDDLVESAMGICHTKQEDPNLERLQKYFRPLADCYERICEQINKTREFYGLRDYYCLIKMLYWLCEKSSTLNSQQLEHAIRRNFGGAQDMDPWTIFKKCLNKRSLYMPATPNPLDDDNLQLYSSPDCSPHGLIYSSLLLSSKTELCKWEDRYLLFLTENYTALQTIYRFLSNVRSDEASTMEEPYILFGSSFPRDKEYTQTCRNINQIKLCMETGRIVILLNLENLYESLYDALNQYYLVHGGKRYVDLGLQTHRMKCQVHPDFRLILIAESQTVYDKFPTPLINRLEKHFVLSKTLLEDWQKKALIKLEAWITTFVSLKQTSELEDSIEIYDQFQPSDVFVGFKDDTPAAIVLQATCNTERFSTADLTSSWTKQFQSKKREKPVLTECKNLLLKITSPDALTRLRFTNLKENEQEELNSIYYDQQCHHSIDALLVNLITTADIPADGLLIQVTTHSHLLDPQQKKKLECDLSTSPRNPNWKVHDFLLQEFDTEEDFIEKTKSAFEDDSENTLLLIQCDSGHLCGDLIACARYRLYDLRAKAIDNHCTTTHVLLIVHLPRKTPTSSFVGFQGSPWICYHLDELQAHDDDMLSTQDALQKPISELFYADSFDSEFVFPNPLNDSDEDLSASGSEINKNSLYQCRRLHNCIQAAASKLRDTEDSSERATQRIETLLQIIPKSGLAEAPLNDCTFHGALVQRIKRLLVLYEEKQESTVKWFHKEALNSKKLQHSGTFRNSLGREIEEMLIMFLAGIIAAVDRHCNLDLVASCGTTCEKIVYKLWINIFLNPEVCQLDFKQMVSGQLPDVGSYSEANFHCKLPFSWIIRNFVISSMEYSTEIKSPVKLLNEVCAKLQRSLLGQLLVNADPSGEASLERLYLHDFVRSTYKCTRRTQGLSEMEFELCQAALDGVCREFLNSTDTSLLHYIAAIHIQYAIYETQLSWFSEIVSNCPGLLKDLMSTKDQIGDKPYMVLPVYAVNQALIYLIDDLDAALADGKQKKLIWWIEKAQKLQETTESVLDWSHQDDEICTNARHRWQQVCALQMLIEHVISKNDSLIHYARRLLLPLKKKDADLSKEATFTRVVNLLGKLSVVLQKKNMDQSLTQGVTLFFMELISNMCFAVLPPEEPVINTVVEIALSPSSTEFAVDANTAPALCVFLLQQLLKYEYQQAADHVQIFIDQAKTKLCGKESELAQLQIHCILGYENLLLRKISPTETVSGRISRVKELIDADHYVSAQSKADSILGIAELRCSLNQFIHVLQSFSVCDPSETSSSAELLDLVAVIQELKERVPPSTLTNFDIVTAFLLRIITRKYGYSSLVTINGMQEILNSRVLLPSVYSYDDKLIDPFVVHDPHYSAMRETVDEAVYTAKGQINQGSLSLTQSNAVPFMLVLYEKVTLASIDAKQYIDEAQEGLLKFMLSKPCEQLSDLVRNTAEKMIKNELGNHLKVKLDVSPTQKLLSALVIHAASVFMCMKEKAPLVGLFVRLLRPPSDMNKTYLPTMPDAFECSNQHRFAHPFKKSVECSDMKCEIVPVHSEKTKYCSRPGYLLGPVQACCDIPFGQRNLQPASFHIIRTLMHAALYWASSEIEATHDFVSQLLQLDDTADSPQFCWDHLKHDLNCLSKAIGHSIDEAVLLVHMILRDIYNKPFQGKDKPDDTLPTPLERRKWEEKFDAMYLKPILQGLEEKLQATVHKNPKKEHDELYLAIYEKLTDVSEEMQWSYYPQLTIEQLSHVICQENVIPFSSMPSVLSLFLEQEPLLRATQYLPRIVKLQQYMHERFHHRVTIEEAQRSTVKEFFRQTEQENLQFSQECRELFEAVKAAWNLVKETLCHYVSSSKGESLPACFDEDAPIGLLIPTAKGPGFCTTALVKFLVYLHNSFIQECNELVALSWKQTVSSGSKKQKADQPRSYRRSRTVKLSRIQPCNLLGYEHALIPVVLLHCYQTSPFIWHFHNLAALEKHILHKFVHGKPIITEEIPLVTFKQETNIQLANDIANIRQNVRQRELPLKIKQDISTELDEVQKLHQTFEDIEIVLHFLGTSGNKLKPTLPLREYFENTLNMKKRPFSSKVKELCNLEHILSLWRTLGKNLAKHHLLTQQEPFDSVPAEFGKEFMPDVKEEFDKVVASIDREEFLSILYEVIMTKINNLHGALLVSEGKEEESRSLVKHLTEYIRLNNLPQIEKFSEEFPESVTIQQAVGVWKYVADIT